MSSVVGGERDLESVKDQTASLNYGGTYRDLQIAVFETLSTVFSSQWLGLILKNKIDTADTEFVVCSDGGRTEDIQPLIRAGHTLCVVQILRDGCSFALDQNVRSYISDNRVQTRTVLNSDLVSFQQQIESIAAEFFAE